MNNVAGALGGIGLVLFGGLIIVACFLDGIDTQLGRIADALETAIKPLPLDKGAE